MHKHDFSELAMFTPKRQLLGQAGALFRQRQQQAIERTVAATDLQFDSHTSDATHGVRGVALDRQLLFQYNDIDLDVQIVPSGDRLYRLIGQLLSDTPLRGVELRLVAADGEPLGRIADELGRFTFSALPSGKYTLVAVLPTVDLVNEFEI